MERTVKDALAESVGVRPEQLTPRIIDDFNQRQVDRGFDPIDPDQVVADDFKITEEETVAPASEESTQPPKKPEVKKTEVKEPPEQWALPEDQKDQWIRRDELNEKYYEKAFIDSDPLRNEEHPAHKVVKDNQKAAQEALREKARLEKELETARKIAFDPEGNALQNDPKRKIYGGISFEDVNDLTDPDHDMSDWLDARDAYNIANRTAEAERLQRESDDAARIEREKAEAGEREKSHRSDLDTVKERYKFDDDTVSKYESQFKEKGVSTEVAFVGQFVIDAGGLEEIKRAAFEEGKKSGGAETMQTVSNNLINKSTDLTNETGKGYTPKQDSFKIPSPEEYLRLSPADKQACKREFDRRLASGDFPEDQ